MTTELRPSTESTCQPEQIALLKRTIAKGATDDEFALFLNVCRHRGLDPFAGQIRPIKRWDATLQRESMTIQTCIDGFRVIADRTGLYAGNERPSYEYEADDLSHPSVAVMTVYKLVQGHRVSFTAEARWDAYVQRRRDGSVTEMWKRMGHLLLAKCAEALVLRQAFPQELSKLYTDEEMMQAESAPSDPSLSDGVKDGTKDQKRAAAAPQQGPDAPGPFPETDPASQAVDLATVVADYRSLIRSAKSMAAATHAYNEAADRHDLKPFTPDLQTLLQEQMGRFKSR